MNKRPYSQGNSRPKRLPQASLKLNAAMNALLTISSLIFPLITFPYISRILLPAGIGKVSFAGSLISYFSMFAQLGIPTYGIRLCAQVRDDREKLTRAVHELIFLNLIMCAVSYLALALALLTIPQLREDQTLYVVTSMTILLSAIGLEWLYRALEQYAYITIHSILCKIFAVAAMFLLVHRQEDYVLYGGISVIAASASSFFNLFHVGKLIDLKPAGNYDILRHIRPVLVFFAMSFATAIYTNMDAVMLGFLTSDADVGYYSAAVKIKTILLSVVTSLGTVLLPRVSYYVEHGMEDKFQYVTQKAMNFVLLISVPLTVYFILFARQGIYFLSGPAYKSAVFPMQIIMPTLILIGITNVLGIQILLPLGLENAVLKSELAGAVVNLLLNALLIPRLAATGAAWGTLTAESVVLLVQLRALKQNVAGVFFTVSYWRIGIATLLSAAGSYWAVSLGLSDFSTLCITACLFFGLYGGFLLLTKEPLFCEILDQMVRH